LFSITCDIDWASDEIVNYFLSIMRRFNIRTTMFCTHKMNMDGDHELAVHPNYESGESYDKNLGELIRLFPDAKGVRNHCMYFSGKILPVLGRYNIQYMSNCTMYKQPMIRPYPVSKDILQLPIYCNDDTLLYFDDSFRLNYKSIAQPGLKIFGFHPIHVFLNTDSIKLYEDAKIYYHQMDKLKRCRNNDGEGVETFLTELLQYIVDNQIQTYTLYEINRLWRGNSLLPNL
jgi:hypothetical protein